MENSNGTSCPHSEDILSRFRGGLQSIVNDQHHPKHAIFFLNLRRNDRGPWGHPHPKTRPETTPKKSDLFFRKKSLILECFEECFEMWHGCPPVPVLKKRSWLFCGVLLNDDRLEAHTSCGTLEGGVLPRFTERKVGNRDVQRAAPTRRDIHRQVLPAGHHIKTRPIQRVTRRRRWGGGKEHCVSCRFV